MSAPFIWIVLPFIFGLSLLVFGSRMRFVEIFGAVFSGFLALLALWLPVGRSLNIRNFVINIPSSLTLMRRQFVIDDDMVGVILAIYGAAFLWFTFAAIVKPGRYFVPIGIVTIAVLVGSISFRTWEFVGVFLLIAVILIVIMLSSTEKKPTQGVINFLTFNILGIPFLLTAGALISGLASTPPGLSIVERPAVSLGLGFAFLLALFPFHSWMPRLAEDGNPFTTGFVLVFFHSFVCILLLEVIDQNVWLRNSSEVFTLLRLIGMVAIISGGFFAAFQRDLGRILGFSALIETGIYLLAIGSGPRSSASLFFPFVLSRSLGLLIWSVGLAEIKKLTGSLRFSEVQGIARRHVFMSAAVILGSLSSVGIPLLIGYVPRIRLYSALTTIAPTAAAAMWIGSLGLFVASFRSLAVLLMLPEDSSAEELTLPVDLVNQVRVVAIGIAIVFLFIGGLIPTWIEPMVRYLPLAFDHLRP